MDEIIFCLHQDFKISVGAFFFNHPNPLILMQTIYNRHRQQKCERVETDINPSMVHHQFALPIRRINIRLYSVTFSVSSLAG